MSQVKVAIIYYSSTGANYQLAQWAAEAATENGAEVKLLKIAETAPDEAIDSNPAWKAHVEATKHVPIVSLDDLTWADAMIFSMPTRYGAPPAQLRSFIDSTGGLWFKGLLTNKIVSAMATASNPHGGQEATLQSFYTSMCHWGAIIVPPGYTDPVTFAAGGNPYGTSATVDQNGKIKEDVEAAVRFQAKRTVAVTTWFKMGQRQ